MSSTLTARLAETAPTWAKAVAPVVERTAQRLLSGTGGPERLPTPLTAANRSAGRDGVRQHPPSAADPLSGGTALFHACADCGVVLDASDRQYCDACLPDIRQQVARQWAATGPTTLARQRADGIDPAHGGEAGEKRGATVADRNREAARWAAEYGTEYDPNKFRRDIPPGLRDMPLSRLMQLTGLSVRYCSLIRRGRKSHIRATGMPCDR